MAKSIAEVGLRPKVSFSTSDTWLNDPNGLLRSQGIWHLFYQNNPFGSVHDNISWGHATSTNLLDWTHAPVAIPAETDEQIFSGSAVEDHLNTSGLGDGEHGPLVAVYTSAYSADHPLHPGIQAQSIAYSLDEGKTWTKYAGNPVLDRRSANFRDPKVFRYPADESAEGRWVMVAVEAEERAVLVYTSTDLIHWALASTFTHVDPIGAQWECPDLFPLRLEGSDETKWVLVISVNPGARLGGSGTYYLVGDFDGETFTPIEDTAGRPVIDWLDFGTDFYAAVTFNGAPDGERLCIGWESNWDYAQSTPTAPWRSSLSVARRLRLVRTASGQLRLSRRPVAPLDELALRGALVAHIEAPRGAREDLGIDLVSAAGDRLRLRLPAGGDRLLIDRSESGDVDLPGDFVRDIPMPLRGQDERIELDIVVDGCVLTVFTTDGDASATVLHFPKAPIDEVRAPETVVIRRL